MGRAKRRSSSPIGRGTLRAGWAMLLGIPRRWLRAAPGSGARSG